MSGAMVVQAPNPDTPRRNESGAGAFQRFVDGPGPAFLLVAIDFFGLGTIMPLLPFYVNEEGAGGVWLGVILTVQGLGVVIGVALMGFMSDKLGRRRVAIFSMLGDALFFFLSGIAPSPAFLAAARFTAGLCCPIPVGYGWIIDITPPEQRAARLGKITGAIMGGMFLGFCVAGGVGEVASFFVCMLCPTVIASAYGLFLVLCVADPPRGESKAKPDPGPVVRHPRWRATFFSLLGVGLMVGTFTAVAMLMMVNKHGLSPLMLGFFNISLMVVMILSNVFLFPIAFKHLGAKLLPLGSIVSGLVMSGAWYAEYSLPLFFLLVMPDFLIAMTLLPAGQTIAANMSKRLCPSAVGTVQGLTRMGFDIGKMIAPVVSTALYSDGITRKSAWAYAWVGVVMVLSAFVFMAIGGESKPVGDKEADATGPKRLDSAREKGGGSKAASEANSEAADGSSTLAAERREKGSGSPAAADTTAATRNGEGSQQDIVPCDPTRLVA